MKTVISALFFVGISFVTFSQELILESLSPYSKYAVGETITLQLKIVDLKESLIPKIKGAEIESDNLLIHSFSLVPTETGKLKIKPISIDLNGKTLKSNALTLTIKNHITKGEILITMPKEISAGESFVIEFSCSSTDIEELSFVEDKNISATKKSFARNISYSYGIHKEVYTQSFNVIISKNGEYNLDASFFEGIPQGYSLRAEKVTVVK
jgi:hypothetical protein